MTVSGIGARASGVATADLLSAIVAATRRILAVREAQEPLAAIAARAASVRSRPGRLVEALARTGRVNVIAECKRRSPSRGVLRERYDPAAIARRYEQGGAAAISVLTESTFFDGDLEHLRAVRAAVELPLLRKDFVVTEYQLHEAKAAGAAAVLLIVGALAADELARLLRRATELGLDCLVEVHDTAELGVALRAGARIVGVNNRNLRTLDVSVDRSAELIAQIPHDVVAVSESGLGAGADLARLGRLGYRAFLIGERLMAADEPGAALEQLIAEAERALCS